MLPSGRRGSSPKRAPTPCSVFPIPAYLSDPLDVRVPVQYHEAIAEVGLPLILFQLQPALAGLNFEPATLRAMASVEGVVAIKEASFDARRFVDTARLLEDLPRPITMLTGNDNFILESFMLGATGALIGFGAVMTGEQVEMIDAWKAGRIDDAQGARAPGPALGRRGVRHDRSATTASASRSASSRSACSRRRTSVGHCSVSATTSVPR